MIPPQLVIPLANSTEVRGQITADELEQRLVGDPLGHQPHQHVMVHSVEKFLEIEVSHDPVARADIRRAKRCRPARGARSDRAQNRRGFRPSYVLINNAGALIRRTPVADYTDGYLDALLDLNVKQIVHFVREGVVQMRAQGGGGSIINLSSIAARHGGGPGSVLYAATKGFVATATRGWAKELTQEEFGSMPSRPA